MTKIAVLLTTHVDDNHEYLNLCLESLKRQEGYEIEVLISDTTLEGAKIKVDLPNMKVFKRDRYISDVKTIENKFSTARAFNFLERQASEDCTHVCTLNDDVILSKYCLSELATLVGDSQFIFNPMCTSENDSWFWTDWIMPNNLGTEAKQFKRFNTLEDVKGYEEAIYNYPISNPRLSFKIEYNPMHCTMINRKLWRALSGMDERFVNQRDDLDFCLRAKKEFNSVSFMATSCKAFHFGGVSANDPVHGITKEMRDYGTRITNEVWNKHGIKVD